MRTGKYSGSSFTWSDGTNFNGFLVIGIVFPTFGGSAYSEIGLEGDEKIRIPQWSIFGIKDGVIQGTQDLIYTADITPSNTQYAAYFYDRTWRQIAAPPSFFTVSGGWTVPATTLTAPVAGVSAPVPGTPVASSLIPYPFNDGLYWDSTNKRLGINVSSPSTALQVGGGMALSSASTVSTVMESTGGQAFLAMISNVAPVDHRKFTIRTNATATFNQLFISASNDSGSVEYPFITATWLDPDPNVLTDLEIKAPTLFLETNRVQYSDRAGSGPSDIVGSGSPEGVVTATVGSTYRRTNGGAGTSFYVKESGSGNTGWVAK